MTVIKRRDTDWKSYLRQLAESPCKISDIERTEFAGYLLRRDLQSSSAPGIFFDAIMSTDNYCIADIIANTLITESPESIEDLTKNIKNIVTDYYSKEIDSLLAIEERIVEDDKNSEKMRTNPHL